MKNLVFAGLFIISTALLYQNCGSDRLNVEVSNKKLANVNIEPLSDFSDINYLYINSSSGNMRSELYSRDRGIEYNIKEDSHIIEINVSQERIINSNTGEECQFDSDLADYLRKNLMDQRICKSTSVSTGMVYAAVITPGYVFAAKEKVFSLKDNNVDDKLLISINYDSKYIDVGRSFGGSSDILCDQDQNKIEIQAIVKNINDLIKCP